MVSRGVYGTVQDWCTLPDLYILTCPTCVIIQSIRLAYLPLVYDYQTITRVYVNIKTFSAT